MFQHFHHFSLIIERVSEKKLLSCLDIEGFVDFGMEEFSAKQYFLPNKKFSYPNFAVICSVHAEADPQKRRLSPYVEMTLGPCITACHKILSKPSLILGMEILEPLLFTSPLACTVTCKINCDKDLA